MALCHAGHSISGDQFSKKTDEAETSDVVEAAKIASAKNPHLTAEIWIENRKAAICRPRWDDPFREKK
jgi:hypothetical protein